MAFPVCVPEEGGEGGVPGAGGLRLNAPGDAPPAPPVMDLARREASNEGAENEGDSSREQTVTEDEDQGHHY